jgi:hypothetical protein
MRLTKRQREIAAAMARVQLMTGDPPGWDWDRAVTELAWLLVPKKAVGPIDWTARREAFREACNVNSSPPWE